MTKCDNRWLTLSVWLTGAPTWPGSSGRRTSSCSTTSSSPRKSGSLSHMSYAFTYNILSTHKRLNFSLVGSFLSTQTKKRFSHLVYLNFFNLMWPITLSSAFMLWMRIWFISREDRPKYDCFAILTIFFSGNYVSERSISWQSSEMWRTSQSSLSSGSWS